MSGFHIDYLTCASRLAESLHGEASVELEEAIALQYVDAGQLEQGAELAQQIPDAYARDSALAAIAAKAVASEREDFATELLDTIEEEILHNSAIEGMAIEFARNGNFKTALEFTDQLANNASAFASIAISYWQRGLRDEAIDLAHCIEFPEQSAATLVQLARLSDQKDETLELLDQARDVAEEIESAELKVFALLSIASVYEERAEREQSLETLNRAFAVGEDFESVSLIGLSADFAQDEALLQILDGFVRLDDLSKATEVADVIEDRLLVARANLSLAVARGKGQPDEATKYLDEAKAGILELRPYGEQEAAVRDALVVELAMSYAKFRNYAEARRIIRLLTSAEKQSLAFKELVKLCISAGDDREVLEIAEDLGSAFDKVQYWLAIYDSTSSSHPELSETALSKASASAADLQHPVQKAEVFTEIALRLAKAQKTEEAENLFLSATTAVTLIDGSFLKARALLRLAKASQDTGREPNQNEQHLLGSMI